MNKSVTKLLTAVTIVVLLGGCKPIFDFFKKKDNDKKVVNTKNKDQSSDVDKGKVLLSIDGKPVVYETDFNKHLTQMLQMNPYFKVASIDSLPIQLKRKFFDELIKQEIIIAFANKENMTEEEEFKKSFEEMKKLVERSLLVQMFESKLFEDIEVSDKELEKYYSENKEKFTKPGGVLVESVEFDNNSQAAEFYNKVKDNKAEFKKLAESEHKNSYQDFGRISQQANGLAANVPAKIKEKALSLKNLPAVVKVQADGKSWIIYASDKKEPELFDLKEIKDQLKNMLKNNKFKEMIDKKIDKIKSSFTLDVNEDFFSQPKPSNQNEGSGKQEESQAPVSAAA